MFAKIEKMLDEEPNIFLCVMVDEIESLAGRRQHSTSGNEPKDSMRAVNALLVALDRLGRHPNVIVFCTSNLIDAIDSAILDRIDVKQYLPGPSTKIRYEIFRRCYLDLLSCSIIVSNEQKPRDDEDVLYNAVGDRSLETWDVVSRPLMNHNEVLPTYEAFELNFRADMESIPCRLWSIAERSTGLSGRVLQRLPVQALAMHIQNDPCTINEAFDALSRMVEEQQLIRDD
ncbi:MAG: hypothetical protein Q9193_001950 [Seirophora villosa]